MPEQGSDTARSTISESFSTFDFQHGESQRILQSFKCEPHHYPMVRGRLEVLDVHNTYKPSRGFLHELDSDGSFFPAKR